MLRVSSPVTYLVTAFGLEHTLKIQLQNCKITPASTEYAPTPMSRSTRPSCVTTLRLQVCTLAARGSELVEETACRRSGERALGAEAVGVRTGNRCEKTL